MPGISGREEGGQRSDKEGAMVRDRARGKETARGVEE